MSRKLSSSDAVDLEHLDYDDVLQMYKSWKNCERELRDKTKELATVTEKVKSLQQSHYQFRGQIQALESVKDLTSRLNAQVSELQARNEALANENEDLTQLNSQAEQVLREHMAREETYIQKIHNSQHELETLKKTYDELLAAHKECEKMARDEQKMRLAAETQLRYLNESHERLTDETRTLRALNDSTTSKLTQCDAELAHASEQLALLSKEISTVKNTTERVAVSEAELDVLKGDIARLVHLFDVYPALQGFMQRWSDSDGMSFVGLGPQTNQMENFAADFPSSIHSASHLEQTSHLRASISDDFDSNLIDDIDDPLNIIGRVDAVNKHITSGQFDHIKRVHNNDPFPMLPLDDELQYWVPRKAAEIGMEFLSANIPHAPPAVIMEFLRKMNKVWQRRETRKFKKVKEFYDKQVKDLKRQINNSKPYQGVMAEKEIRRLKAQLTDGRKRVLNGRAVGPENRVPDYAEEDFIDYDSLPPHRRRPCQVKREPYINENSSSMKAKVVKASTKKLLEASLMSLETLGRQVNRRASQDFGASLTYSKEFDSDIGSASRINAYPSESYLLGAVWLGKNVIIILEELVDNIDSFRVQHLRDLSLAMQDTDKRRCCHRLSLLVASSLNETLNLIQKGRTQAREMLQGVANIHPGDSLKFQELVTSLPTESIRKSSSLRSSI